MSQLIGLTGGIASGKSTVVAFLKQEGYQVIDADKLVHDLQQKGGRLYQALLAEFGPDILQENGQLDRAKLGQLIFSSPEMLDKSARLQNGIIRQALWEEKERLLEQEDLFFMDIPLLFEQDYQTWFDQVWLVDVSEETQLERLIKRNNLTLEEAKQRTAAQMSLEQKRSLADVLIDNNGSLEHTLAQVRELLEKERR